MSYGTTFIEEVVREQVIEAESDVAAVKEAGYDIEIEEKVGEGHPDGVTGHYHFRGNPPERWPLNAGVRLFAAKQDERHYLGSATVEATMMPDYGEGEDRIIAKPGAAAVAIAPQTAFRLVGSDLYE